MLPPPLVVVITVLDLSRVAVIQALSKQVTFLKLTKYLGKLPYKFLKLFSLDYDELGAPVMLSDEGIFIIER